VIARGDQLLPVKPDLAVMKVEPVFVRKFALEQDRVGNVFARRDGTPDGAPSGRAPIVVGSHLDTVRTGGAYDGAYGVVGALCALERLGAEGATTRHPVEAVAWAGEEGSRFPLGCLGSGAYAGLNALEAIEALVGELGLAGQVIFLGCRAHAEFLDEALLCHLFLSPSVTAADGDTEGGAPVAIIEAAATGLPVVASLHADIPEVIRDGETGWLVKDGEQLADVVDRATAITGRVDLLHCNNSRDEFGSGRDRHAPVLAGTIAAQQLVAVCAAADAPVVLETDPDSQAKEIAWLREQLDS